MDLTHLRQTHQRLIYEGFSLLQVDQDLVLTFKLTLEPDLKFSPSLKIKNLPSEILEQVNNQKTLDPTLERLFFQLGLAEIPSYFKLACPSEILIRHQGQISAEAIPFWQDLLIRGLGEFYYQNQIDFTTPDFIKIKLEKTTTSTPVASAQVARPLSSTSSPVLIPVGGGKDSATVLGIMEKRQLPYDIFLLAPHAPAAKKIATLLQKNGHCQNIIEAERSIDPQLIALNRQGYLNGHTPFSAYLAFASTTLAYLCGQNDILLGNEASSEEENLLYLGQQINHQYSKSLDFEQKFRHYSKHQIFDQQLFAQAKGPQYTSLLRPFSELQITAMLCDFAKQNQTFAQILTTFKSCNVGQQQDRWCHNCPKCAFVFSMLSAYLDETVVSQQIFTENLFAKKSLEQTFFDLAGFGDKKPFECVGTFAEVRQAILLAYARSKKPSPFLRQLRQKIQAKNLLTKLREQSILILGMGREGLSTLEFLRQYFPNKKIAVADSNEEISTKQIDQDPNLITYFGQNYLAKLDQYKLIIKTAGIPITTEEIQRAMKNGSEILSNTQIFFTLCPGTIIGITGTKGKSTTSKLTYEILRDAGLDAVLLGNIGEAPLKQLHHISTQTLVVDELSCHQLAELQESPQVAIVLDIKSEHLDYYKDFASYFQAKSAIALFQKADDYLIYNPSLEGANQMAKLSSAQKLTHSLSDQLLDEIGLKPTEIPLVGEHQLYNVLPAILTGQLFGATSASIKKTILNFHNLHHRLELVATVNGVKFFDDSIGVNPHATIMAIKSFPKNSVILLAGGYERNQDFSELAKIIVAYQVKSVIALPSTGQRLVEFVLSEAKATDISILTHQVNTIEEAVTLAKRQAQAGDIVLLSPASASYNTFKSYEERGDAFRDAALNLDTSLDRVKGQR